MSVTYLKHVCEGRGSAVKGVYNALKRVIEPSIQQLAGHYNNVDVGGSAFTGEVSVSPVTFQQEGKAWSGQVLTYAVTVVGLWEDHAGVTTNILVVSGSVFQFVQKLYQQCHLEKMFAQSIENITGMPVRFLSTYVQTTFPKATFYGDIATAEMVLEVNLSHILADAGKEGDR
jgi:hypothetical protein